MADAALSALFDSAQSRPRKKPTFPDMICERCGAACAKGSSRQKYCHDCSDIVRAERDAARIHTITPIVGMLFDCTRCGNKSVKTSGSQKYCANCSTKSLRERDRAAQARKRKTPESKAKERERAKTRNASTGRRAYVRGYEAARVTNDPKFALNKRMRAQVSRGLRESKGGRSWRDLVGYTCDELMAHLERQFPAGMTWGNRHEWEIDHIVPVSAFDFSTPDCRDFKACWALTNLRPLWKSKNREKWHHRTHLI